MNIIRNFIRCTLAIGCFTHAVHALDHESDIRIRIHAPFSDLYPGEMDYWLVRVENHGAQAIPIPSDQVTEKDEGPPPQFHIQTEEAALAGEHPKPSPWQDIERFGYGFGDFIEKSVLEPGFAMEAFSWGLPGQLRTPPNGGKFRIAFQIGPDEFVYSNWITRIRRGEAAPVMRVVHIGTPHGPSSPPYSMGISENTKPQYLWNYCNTKIIYHT